MHNQIWSQLVATFALGCMSCGPEVSIERISAPSVDMSSPDVKDQGANLPKTPDVSLGPIYIPVTLSGCKTLEKFNNTFIKPFSTSTDKIFPIQVKMTERCEAGLTFGMSAFYEGRIECRFAQSTIDDIKKIHSSYRFGMRVKESSKLYNILSPSGNSILNSRGELYFDKLASQRHLTANAENDGSSITRISNDDIGIFETDLLNSDVVFLFRFSCYTNVNRDTVTTSDTEWSVDSLSLYPIQ